MCVWGDIETTDIVMFLQVFLRFFFFFFFFKCPQRCRGTLLKLIPSDTEPQEHKKLWGVAGEEGGTIFQKEWPAPYSSI